MLTIGSSRANSGERPSLRRRRFLRRLAASMAAAAAMTPSMAEAQFTGSGGAYVSFTFGDQIGVGWGLEGAFGGYIEMDGGCDDCDGAVVGPVFQLGWINLEELRLAAWLQAGGEIADNTGIVGEVGIVGHVLDPGVGVHTGLLVQFPYYLVGFARRR